MADYPDNCPDMPIDHVNVSNGYLIQLQPRETVALRGTFVGTDTGCAVFIHDVASGKLVLPPQVHNLGISPEAIHDDNHQDLIELKGDSDKKTTFLFSVWTFIGGPPTVNRPYGWNQDPPLPNTIIPSIPGRVVYVCEGSTHGSTTVSIAVSPL